MSIVRGDLVRRWRVARGLSLRALAEKAGVSYQTIAHLETGVQNPRPATLKKIADALGVDAERFINWEGEAVATGKAAA